MSGEAGTGSPAAASSRPPRSYTLRELAERFGGDIVGDPAVRVERVATLDRAGAGDISFLSNERYFRQLRTTRAAAVIVAPAAREATAVPRIVCANPYAYYARVSSLLNPPRAARATIHESAVIDSTARIDPSAEIGPLTVISCGATVGANTIIGARCFLGENVRIGSDGRINSGVTLYGGCTIGDRAVIHSGVVLGADGFGIAFDAGKWIKVPQIGGVKIGDDVEIGANTTIDRGAIEDTVLENGVKLDNQIQIAHNVKIGENTAIAACTGIAGSVHIGRNCRIGGGVGIAGHVEIADNVEISGYTAITKSISASGMYSGVYPFESNREWRRNAAQLRHLSDIARRMRALEDKLEELTRAPRAPN